MGWLATNDATRSSSAPSSTGGSFLTQNDSSPFGQLALKQHAPTAQELAAQQSLQEERQHLQAIQQAKGANVSPDLLNLQAQLRAGQISNADFAKRFQAMQNNPAPFKVTPSSFGSALGANAVNAAKGAAIDTGKAVRAVGRPVVDAGSGQGGKLVHDTAQLSSDVSGGTVNQFAKAAVNTPAAVIREAQNKPVTDIQKNVFGTTDQGDIAKKIIGSTAGTAAMFVGGGGGRAAVKAGAAAEKALPALAKSAATLGAAGGVGNAAATVVANPKASLKQVGTSAAEGVGAGVALAGLGAAAPKILKGASKVINNAKDSNLIKPLGESGAKGARKGMGEAGSIAPGQILEDTKALVEKHQTPTKFSGDVARGADSVEGTKKLIQQDATSLIKNREKLSTADMKTIQDYRDQKAAGLTPEALPEHLQAHDAAITELNKQSQKADAELARLNGHEDKAKTIEARDASTYTHREAQAKGSSLDYLLQGDRKNPISVGGLSKTTPGSKSRTFMAVTDEAGNRQVVAVKRGRVTALDQAGATKQDLGNLNQKTNATLMEKELAPVQSRIDSLEKEQRILSSTKGRSQVAVQRLSNIKTQLQDLYRQHAAIGNKYDLNELEGKSFVSKDGTKYKLGQATTKEITKATGQKYYVDPHLMAVKNFVESRSALENARFIESIKSDPVFEKVASAPGQTAPKGWKSLGMTFPQLGGYRFEPKVADTLKDIASGYGEKDALDKIGKVLRQTIVYFPVKHDLNMAAAYMTDRGISGIANPVKAIRGVKALYDATREVINHGPTYRALLKNGFSMVTADNKAFQEQFSKELDRLVNDKTALESVARQLGTSPKRLVKAYSATQHVSVWMVQDILNTARVMERMQGGLLKKAMPLEQAMKQTERFNYQYKAPSRVAGSRNLSRLLTSDKVFFGRYKYDQFKILGNILKDSVNVIHPVRAAQALDKLGALLAISLILWPEVNKGIQKISGNPNANIKAPGPTELPETIDKIRKGKESAGRAAGNLVYLGPLQTADDVKNNRDSFTGKQIYDPNASGAEQGKAVFNWLKNTVAPVQRTAGLKNADGNKAVNIGLMLSGTNFPKNSPESSKLSSLKYDTLPNVQATFKKMVQQGNTSGAKALVDNYNQQIFNAAKAAIKSSGKPVPSDQRLWNELKKNQYLASKTDKVIKNAQKKQVNTIDKLLQPSR